MKTHAILLEELVSETLCHVQIGLEAVLNGVPKVTSKKTGCAIKAVWANGQRNFDCNTCRHVWRNITRG